MFTEIKTSMIIETKTNLLLFLFKILVPNPKPFAFDFF